MEYRIGDMPEIVYFSGTGGTARVAGELGRQLSDRGIVASSKRIGRDVPTIGEDATALFLLFPVYEFNAPFGVIEWLLGLAPRPGMPAVVLSVSGGGEVFPNRGCRADAIRILEGKGFAVAYEDMFVLPPNIFVDLDPGIASLLLSLVPVKAARVVDLVAGGIARRARPNRLDRGLSASGLKSARKYATEFGRSLAVSDACVGCGTCARECPVGNIATEADSVRILDHCAFCLNCVYACPKRAILPNAYRFVLVKRGYRLADFEKVEPDKSARPRGVFFAGIRKYIDETGSGK